MLYILIPAYNRWEYTSKCLIALRNQKYKLFRTIVIDDGSTDETNSKLRTDFPEVILIQGNGNLWWTRSINLGVEMALKQCDASAVLTLNNDTIPEPDFIAQMINASKNKPDAILGAFEIDEQKKPIFGGGYINWKRARTVHLLDFLDRSDLHGLQRVNYFPGRGLYIPINIFRIIGLFDDKNFPQYAADYDFTHRAIRAGFEIFCNYDAKLVCFPKESGDFSQRANKSLCNYFNHLFGIKGGGNLIIFTRYAFRNCPKKYLPYFYINGIIRRIFGYLYDWIFKK